MTKASSVLRITLAVALLTAGTFGAVGAQEKDHPGKHTPAQHQPTDDKGLLRLLPADSVTQHVIDTAQDKLAYTATAGTLAALQRLGRAERLDLLHRLCEEGMRPNRPLTFAFNGGPGRPPPSCISALSARASSISDRMRTMPRAPR